MKKQYNEKPSKYTNIGEDVTGARRHNYDTYENPDREREKRKIKEGKTFLLKLKADAIYGLRAHNYEAILTHYEFKKMCFTTGFDITMHSKETQALARQHIRDIPYTDTNKRLYTTRFNSFLTKCRKIRYMDYDTALKYFETKSKISFTEHNGIKQAWKLDNDFNENSVTNLANKVKGVQFGNSLKESEREYCLHNLSDAIDMIEAHFTFDFKSISFSYGARGVAGSIAHYQDSQKVLAFNRGWDGAFIHELGHAIDYSLNLVSRDICRDLHTKYFKKLCESPTGNNNYYLKRVEMFARLFEVYIRKTIPETTTWMQFTFNESIMPDLDDEAMEFMIEALKPIMK